MITETEPYIEQNEYATYESPERAINEKYDYKADVWSFGELLYELTQGKKCFNQSFDSEGMDYTIPDDIIDDEIRTLIHLTL